LLSIETRAVTCILISGDATKGVRKLAPELFA